MLRVHAPAAHVERRAEKFFNPHQLKARGRADNIHDRVHCAHLVKVHFLDRRAVHQRFGFAEAPENCAGSLRDSRRQAGLIDQMKDGGKRAVPLRIGELHFDLGRPETAA